MNKNSLNINKVAIETLTLNVVINCKIRKLGSLYLPRTKSGCFSQKCKGQKETGQIILLTFGVESTSSSNGIGPSS